LLAESWIFLIMLGTFLLTAFAFNLPIGICLMIASVCGALSGGQGFALRHLFEGSFGYLNTILVIATAMMFMKGIQKSGLLDTVARALIQALYKSRVLLLIGLTLLVMFPGAVTGSSTACVLTTGALVVPVLMAMGLDKLRTGAFIAMAAIYGMLAPPVNIPAMLIGGGIDMPYVGFTLPLLAATVPLAIIVSLFIALPHMKPIKSLEAIADRLPVSYHKKYGFRLYIPLVVLLALMVGPSMWPGKFPDLGMPLAFALSALSACLTGKPVNIVKMAREAVRDSMPVMAILMGVGMFIQIMTLTGVRGWVVNAALSLPAGWIYVAMALAIPAFGAVSAFGSSSVLGVPFLLALIGSTNEIVAASGLTLLAGLGDLVPPTALAGIFAAQVVGEENYFKVMKYTVTPFVLTALWGVAMVIWAKPLARFLVG